MLRLILVPFAVVRVALIVSGLTSLAAAPLRAQCADGTPPPCEVPSRRVAARATPPPEQERGRSFLVLPFRNVTRSPDHEWLVDGSPTLLADALGQWDEITVVPPERLYPAMRRHGLEPGAVMDEDRVRRVSEETGGWTAVTGEILATGSRIRVSARAYDVVSEKVVVRAAEDAETGGDIRAVYERLAGRLLRTAGLETPSPDLSAATTQSLDAYKAYLRGVAHYNRSEYRSAREAFSKAVALDSSFAQAYAKLSVVSMTSVQALRDPQSPVYRYVERAGALSGRLPPRERELIQGLNAAFHGQLGVAREAFEHLVATDSNDVEALENLGNVEIFDPLLVTIAGIERPRGSLNEAARLAKRVLFLDPTRHQAYNTLVQIYAMAGGYLSGIVVGLRREAPSLPALLHAQPDEIFVALLRDSVRLVPAESLATIPGDTLGLVRQRARTVALEWVGRWLAAAPAEAQAHMMASTVYELDEQYDAALVALDRAESLGLELELENLSGRRMILQAKRRQFAEARRIADSLLDAGYFAADPLAFSRFTVNHSGWAFSLYLMTGQFERAEAVTAPLQAVYRKAGLDSNRVGETTLCILACPPEALGGLAVVQIPEEIRLAVLDSMLMRLRGVPEEGLIAEHVGFLLDQYRLAGWAARGRLAASAWQAATRLSDGGRADLAVMLASGVVSLDTTMGGRLAVLEMLQRVSEAEPGNVSARYQIGRVGALTGNAALAHQAIGILTDTGQTDRAVDLASVVINIDTTEAGRRGVFERLERVIQIEPDNLSAHYQIGKLGALTGRNLDLAEASLNRYLRHGPPAGGPPLHGAHWRLGMIYEHRGELDRARAAYEEALRINPDFQPAKQALEQLEAKSN